jgi:hypothetical protein
MATCIRNVRHDAKEFLSKLNLEAYTFYRSNIDEFGREIYQTFVFGGSINLSYLNK